MLTLLLRDRQPDCRGAGGRVPHLIVEYSANAEDRIGLEQLLDALHATALATGIFPEGGLRVRAFRADHYRIADRHPDNAYVHVTALVGYGRPLDVRERAGGQLFECLKTHLAPAFEAGPLAISFNIQEFDPVLNFKHNNLHRYVKSRREGGPDARPADASTGREAGPNARSADVSAGR